MAEATFTPHTAANRLTHWLDALEAVGVPRFPIDVAQIALHVGPDLKWPDPIFKVEAADIPSFEGGLFHLGVQGWALLYNKNLSSPGRVRFTQAHELGHYMLHRLSQEQFNCSEADMVHWGEDQHLIEKQADEFASNLLMPMKQFRSETSASVVDLEVLSAASIKFGVSLTAAALRWIKSTTDSAVLVLSRDGFMDWSVSTDKARANGAFFRTRGRTIPLPQDSLAAKAHVASSRLGEHVPLKRWFEHAHPDAAVREMKLVCDNHGYTLSLLRLSPGDKVWPPWGQDR